MFYEIDYLTQSYLDIKSKFSHTFLYDNDYSSIINIYTSMKHSLLLLKLLALALNSLDTGSDIIIKVFTLLF
jgi:hypothetical protein